MRAVGGIDVGLCIGAAVMHRCSGNAAVGNAPLLQCNGLCVAAVEVQFRQTPRVSLTDTLETSELHPNCTENCILITL